MNANTVPSSVNLIGAKFTQFSITTSTTAQRMVPLPLSVTGITRTGRTATATTASAHNYWVGQYVYVEGADQPEYNGLRLVTSIPSATTFTYEIPSRGPNGIPDSDLPVTPATAAVAFTTRIKHEARTVILRTGANSSDTVGIGPNASADWYEVPASTEYRLPEIPQDSKIDLNDWWVQGSANTPVITVLYC